MKWIKLHMLSVDWAHDFQNTKKSGQVLMSIEDCIIKSKEWLHELNHKQLVHTLCGEINNELDKTVALFESLLNHLEDCNEMEDEYNEKISSLEDECYERGYNKAIDDVVFELNNQDVDDDVISLIKDM